MKNKEYPTYVFEERMESIKKNLRNYCNDTLDYIENQPLYYSISMKKLQQASLKKLKN